jgi:hypothetical protein
LEDGAADRTDTAAVSFKAVYAAGNMHQPVCALKCGEGCRFDPFAVIKLGAAYRTGPGGSGETFAFALNSALSPVGRERNASGNGKKQCITEPNQKYSDNGKKKYLYKSPHFTPFLSSV